MRNSIDFTLFSNMINKKFVGQELGCFQHFDYTSYSGGFKLEPSSLGQHTAGIPQCQNVI